MLAKIEDMYRYTLCTGDALEGCRKSEQLISLKIMSACARQMGYESEEKEIF